MTDDDSPDVPPYCNWSGSGLYPSSAAKWMVDIWTGEKLVLRWIHPLEEDLSVLPATCTLNRESFPIGISRKGQFGESLMFHQLLSLLIETWGSSRDFGLLPFLELTSGELFETIHVSMYQFFLIQIFYKCHWMNVLLYSYGDNNHWLGQWFLDSHFVCLIVLQRWDFLWLNGKLPHFL